MKYFIDTEFREYPRSIELISIGIVTEDGKEYYAVSKDFDLNKAWKNEWLRENVFPSIHTDLCEKMGTYGKTCQWKLFEPFTKRSLRNLINWYG